MTVLSVNLNKVALLRNSRGQNLPNVLHMAQRATARGAAGVTIHPRPDERHATRQDARELARWVRSMSGTSDVELNIEGYPSEDFLELMNEVRPHQCTLVPDAPGQLTSDHGWDLPAQTAFLIPILTQLRENGIRTSLFIDPDPEAARAAVDTGTDRVELYTGPYAAAYTTTEREAVTRSYEKCAQAALERSLGLNAGHDLDLKNLGFLLERIPGILEVSIGHALTVEALDFGWDETIRRYVGLTSRTAGDQRESQP
ncbi:MAG: pyridoxine 5'-phosphate synthase [Candidatus Methylacidiphilales bacterium]